MGFFTLDLDEKSIEEILHDPDGPVGDLLAELAAGMTAKAEALVPFQSARTASWTKDPLKSTSYMPLSSGFTEVSIWYHPPALDTAGRLFAGTNAAYAPTNWLEKGRRTGHRMTPHPFLSGALFATTL